MRYEFVLYFHQFISRPCQCLFLLGGPAGRFSPFLAFWSRGSDREGNYDPFIRAVGIDSP